MEVNKSMNKLFSIHGITYQLTCPYIAQQNRMVELNHRYLLQVERAIRFQSKIPIEFCGYCILCATFIIDRLPRNKIDSEQEASTNS